MFPDIGRPIADTVNAGVRWLVVNYGGAFESFANALLFVLVPIEQGLRALPPWLVLVAVALIALAASRKIVLSIGLACLMWLVGALGLWDQAMQTVAIVLVSVTLAILIGIPVGILAGR